MKRQDKILKKLRTASDPIVWKGGAVNAKGGRWQNPVSNVSVQIETRAGEPLANLCRELSIDDRSSPRKPPGVQKY